MDLENEYRETKIMKTATNSAPTTPLSAQNFQIMQPITSSQFNIIHFDWLDLSLSGQNFGRLNLVSTEPQLWLKHT